MPGYPFPRLVLLPTTMMLPSTKCPSFRIETHGNRTQVFGPHELLLEFPAVFVRSGPNLFSAEIGEYWWSRTDDGDERMELPTAVLPALERYLAELGATVHSEDHSPDNHLAEPCWARLSHLHLLDMGLLNLVQHEPYGVIRIAKDQVSRARLIAQVALANPEMQIVVMEHRRDGCEKLAHEIGRFDIVASVIHGKSRSANGLGRVLVCTPDYAEWCVINESHRVILIVHDASEVVLNPNAWKSVSSAIHARLYGILPIATRLSPKQELKLRAMFGFPELVIPCHGCVQRPVIASQECFR